MQLFEYTPPEIPRLRKKSGWQSTACIVVLGGGALTVLLWLALTLVSYICPTRQQRIDRLFTAWLWAESGEDRARINKKIARLGKADIPELCVALDGVGERNFIGKKLLMELERINDPSALEGLARCVRRGGRNATGALGLLITLARPQDEANLVELLAQCLESRCRSSRREAAIELARRKDERALEPLLEMLSDENGWWEWQIVPALRNYTDPRAKEAVRHSNQRAAEEARGLRRGWVPRLWPLLPDIVAEEDLGDDVRKARKDLEDE
jgi:hypothetical protein